MPQRADYIYVAKHATTGEILTTLTVRNRLAADVAPRGREWARAVQRVCGLDDLPVIRIERLADRSTRPVSIETEVS